MMYLTRSIHEASLVNTPGQEPTPLGGETIYQDEKDAPSRPILLGMVLLNSNAVLIPLEQRYIDERMRIGLVL